MNDNITIRKRTGIAYLILTALELPFIGMYAGTASNIEGSGDFSPLIEMYAQFCLIPFGILCFIGATLLVIRFAGHNEEQKIKLEPPYKIGLTINTIYLLTIFTVALKYG